MKKIPETEHISSSNINLNYNKDGSYYLIWDNKILHGTSLIFFENGISNGLAMIPDDTKTFNSWVETYNEKFVGVSNMDWKYYSGGNVFSIHAEYHSETNSYSVLFKLEH